MSMSIAAKKLETNTEMAKTASAAIEEMIKDAKNRLAKAIEAAGASGGYAGMRRAAGLKTLQEATKPAVKPMAGRFLDVQKQVQARPKLRTAAMSLLREKRL